MYCVHHVYYKVAWLILVVTIPTAMRAHDTVQNENPSRQRNQSPKDKKSIEEKTRIHRLSTTQRAIYDAFVYVNRIPVKPEKSETSSDFAGRIFGRLANQEGRVLLKVPPGMDKESYLAFKTFFRYEPEGKKSIGNCAACHTPVGFTDLKKRVVMKGESPQPTPSLRNLKKRKVDVTKALMKKIAASRLKQSGNAHDIDDAYKSMKITKKDVPGLVKFLGQLNDVKDADFREFILNATLLDTSEDIE